jgi:hypothetical protein
MEHKLIDGVQVPLTAEDKLVISSIQTIINITKQEEYNNAKI